MSFDWRKTASWIWRHCGAFLAVVLILVAIAVGFRWGASGASDEKTSTEPKKTTWYTCSMHPTIAPQSDPKAKCPICFMDLIPIPEGELDLGPRELALSERAVHLAEIETAAVARFFPRAEVRLFGRVTYDETSVARLTAYFSGRVERLFVNYVGIPVQKGDHLAELYSPELLTVFEELRQAAAASRSTDGGTALVRRTTQDTLVAAREKLRLFGVTPSQIASIEDGSYTGDRLTIYAPIGGVVTHLSVREGDYLKTGQPIATVADLTHLWLDLEAYESQLPLLRWGQPVTFTVESHPGETFEGRVAFIEPMVDERTRTAAVRVAVDNPEMRLKPGMFASAVLRPRIGAEGAVVSDELAGRWVSPMHPTVVKDAPGTCDVCGMDLVSAESLGIVGDPTKISEPLVIPRSAVLFTGRRSVVYVQVPGRDRPVFESRDVVLGPRAGNFYTVRSGLDVGERVVVNGAFRIDSAMQLKPKPSMMNPSAERASDPDADGDVSPRVQAQRDLPAAFLFSLKPVFAAYLDAQEALADDDLARYSTAIGDLSTALGLVDTAGVVGDGLGAWKRSSEPLLEVTRQDPATTIDEARQRFERLSQAVIDLDRRFGHRGSSSWFVAYCPMAFDNAGAEWLQRTSTIDNPYFGASMLRCGEIREELHAFDLHGDLKTEEASK